MSVLEKQKLISSFSLERTHVNGVDMVLAAHMALAAHFTNFAGRQRIRDWR